MQAKALKTFRGKYGMIRAGSKFNCAPRYFDELKKLKMVTEWTGGKDAKEDPPAADDPQTIRDPGPSENASIPEAPATAGKDQAASSGQSDSSESPDPAKDSGRRRGAGKPLTSRSLRADLQSRKKTSRESNDGDLTMLAAAAVVTSSTDNGE